MSLCWRTLAVVAVVFSIFMPGVTTASQKNKKDEDSYTIGGVLSGYESEKHFRETIEVSGVEAREAIRGTYFFP